MKAKVIAIITSIICIVSCNVQEGSYNPSDGSVSFRARYGDDYTTKTVLQSDGSVLWNAADQINVFVGTKTFVFTSSNNKASAEVVFNGNLDGVSWDAPNEYWAVYPQSPENTFDGDSVTVSLPDYQEATANTFARDLFISIAKSSSFDLTFYNVCGGIKFSLTEPGVKSVTFRGNNGEVLAGKAKVSLDDSGTPAMGSISEKKSEITLYAKDDSTFEVGKWYYIVCFPSTLERGYDLILTKEDGTVAERKNEKPVSIKRAIWGRLTESDKTLSYDLPANQIWYYTTNNQKITYLPSSLSSHLITNTYEEGKGVLSFDEPLTAIPDEAFWLPDGEPDYGNLKQLSKIILPPGIKSIGSAFVNIDSLEEVELPEGLETITGGFNSLQKLKKVVIPSSVQSISTWCFYKCPMLITMAVTTGNEKFDSRDDCNAIIETESNILLFGCAGSTIPSTVVGIGNNAFYYRTTLSAISLPSSLTSIGDNAFQYCDNLSSIDLSSISVLGYGSFARCKNLTDVKLGSSLSEIGQQAFAFSGLTSIVLPESIVTIKGSAFESCPLTSVVSLAINPPVLSYGGATYGDFDPFKSTTCPIYVPQIAVDAYISAWSVYSSRIAMLTPDYQYIDLGLSVRWCDRNIGAYNPENVGYYYAWGEILPKTSYTFDNYKWGNGYSNSYPQYKKYCSDTEYGSVDYLTSLEQYDDAAYKELGTNWRMPTYNELKELLTKCQFDRTIRNGVNGYNVTGPSGNSIFIPLSGAYSGNQLYSPSIAAFYSVTSVGEVYRDDVCATTSAFGLQYYEGATEATKIGWFARELGLPIRPVYQEGSLTSWISFNSYERYMLVGDSNRFTVKFYPTNAVNTNLRWSSSNSSVAIVDQDGVVTAKSVGETTIIATTEYGARKATQTISVGPAPVLSFNTDSYLVYRANPSGGWDARNENYYHYESSLSGIKGKVVEIKFQLASSSDQYCTIASDNLLKDWYQELKLSTSKLEWNQGDPTDYRFSVSLSDAGVSRTSLINLRFDGNAKTLSINGKSYSVPFDTFDFGCLFAEYNHESDEGVWESTDGIPDGSKMFYYKAWDESGNLQYLGYPSKAINPATGNEEYCWYTYAAKRTYYQFANDSKNQGAYTGYIK